MGKWKEEKNNKKKQTNNEIDEYDDLMGEKGREREERL